jgi:hypothetical protein
MPHDGRAFPPREKGEEELRKHFPQTHGSFAVINFQLCAV